MDIESTIAMYNEARNRVLSRNPTPTTITDALLLNDLVDEEVEEMRREAEHNTLPTQATSLTPVDRTGTKPLF